MANLSTYQCSSLTHHIDTFTLELYKGHKNLSQAISSYLFMKNNSSFNLHSKSDFIVPQVRATWKGSNYSMQWSSNLVFHTSKYKIYKLPENKNIIWKWKSSDCPCRILLNYITNIGFLDNFNWLQYHCS